MISPILEMRKQRLGLNDVITVMCLIRDPKIKPGFSDFSNSMPLQRTVKFDYYRNEMVPKQNYASFPKTFSICGLLVASG